MRKTVVVLLTILLPLFSFSQILNLDRTVVLDSTGNNKKKYAATLGASFSSFQQTYSFVDGALNYDLTHYLPRHNILVLSGRNGITTTGKTVIQNLGFIHLRFRDNDTRAFSPEPFTQYQWNTTLGLMHRYLLGCNLRTRLLNSDKADIYYGIGAMYESEQWNYDGVIDPYLVPPSWSVIKNDFYKTNQYLKASISINDKCDIVTALFLQNKVDDFMHWYRLSNYLSFNIRISRKFFFSVSADVAYDNNPVVPIKNTIYSFISSISIKL